MCSRWKRNIFRVIRWKRKKEEEDVYCDVIVNCINVYYRNIVLLGGPNFKKKKKKKKVKIDDECVLKLFDIIWTSVRLTTAY